MKVLVLTPYLYGTAPGPRSSIELWERVLRPEGITFEYAPFESERLHDVLHEPGHTAVKAVEMLRSYAGRLPTIRAAAGWCSPARSRGFWPTPGRPGSSTPARSPPT